MVVTTFSKRLDKQVGPRTGKAFIEAQEVFLAKKENKIRYMKFEEEVDHRLR